MLRFRSNCKTMLVEPRKLVEVISVRPGDPAELIAPAESRPMKPSSRGSRPGKLRLHLDRRELDLRQRRDRQQTKRDDAGERNRDRQQRRADRDS